VGLDSKIESKFECVIRITCLMEKQGSDNMTTNVPTNANPDSGASGNSSVVSGEGSRIADVEREVKKLKADVEGFMDLKNAVDDLKNTIVDIRALISEVQSPFNLLQLITNEDDLNKVIQAKPLIEKKFLAGKTAEAGTKNVMEAKSVQRSGLPETVASEAASTEEGEKETGFSVETSVEASEPEKLDRLEKAAVGSLKDFEISGLEKDTSLVEWVYMMLDLGFDEASIGKVCDFCEFSGFMPKGYSVHVSNLVGAIVKARSKNLSAEEVVLTIYNAADAVGVETNPKDLKRLLINVLKRRKAGEMR